MLKSAKLAIDPTVVRQMIRDAEAATKHKDYASATRILKKILQTRPAHRGAFTARVQIAISVDDGNYLASEIERISVIVPGLLASAMRVVEKTEDDETLAMCAELLAVAYEGERDEDFIAQFTSVLIARARRAFASRKDVSARLSRAAYALDPNRAEPLTMIRRLFAPKLRSAAAARTSGETTQARSMLKEIIEDDPQNVDAHTLAGHLAFAEDRLAEALEHYSQTSLENYGVLVLRRRLIILQRLGHHRELAGTFRVLMSLLEENGSVLERLAINALRASGTAMKSGDFVGAAQLLGIATKVLGERPTVRKMKAALEARIARRLREWLVDSIRLDSEEVAALTTEVKSVRLPVVVARRLAKKGDGDTALALLEKIDKENAEPSYEVLATIAQLRYTQRDFKLANESATRALGLKPDAKGMASIVTRTQRQIASSSFR